MTREWPSQQAEPGMRRCKEWSIDVQADAYKCGEGAALVLAALRIALAALRMSNAHITIFYDFYPIDGIRSAVRT